MKRNLFFISLWISCLWATSVFAADTVPLRISEKGDYDRIVFDWSSAVEYKLQNNAGSLIIRFSKPADISENIKAVENIGAHKVISNNPLEVQFTIPKSSKVRDFKIGKRVVLDIYDPTNPNDQRFAVASPAKKEVSPPKPKTGEPEEKGKAPVQETASEQTQEKPQEKAKMPAAPPAFVLVPENLAKNEKEKKEDTNKTAQDEQKAALKRAVNQENHTISVRATTNFGLSAFLMHDELWLVMDNDTALITPNLSSGSTELFGDFRPVNVAGANAYRLNMPQDMGFKIKAQGAGLLWDLIIGDKVKQNVAPEPVRKKDGAILFPLQSAAMIMEAQHPETGENITLVTSNEARQFGAYKSSYVEFEILHSPLGLAILPKVDDLSITKTERGILITRPQGLALASESDQQQAKIFQSQKEDVHGEGDEQHDEHGKKEDHNLYKFKSWALGSTEEITKNQNALLAAFPDKSESRRVEDLITLGKMMLSHGLAAEALGYFDFAADELPGLVQSAEFKALRGAAYALDWKSEDALRDLLHKSLKDQDEVKYWTAYVLADLGDWQQAASVLPKDYKALYSYPNHIAHKLALSLAEVNLRAGKINIAKELLAFVGSSDEDISPPNLAALKYLQGEASRQQGDIEQTKELWQKLAGGDDDLYSVKAGLALTILESNEKKIDSNEVVDRLEGLRYAWRGDDLEAQVKYWLGKGYFDKDEFIVGLSIMRDAASVSGQTALARRIASDMAKTYTDLFMGPKLKDVPALEAVAIYEQFQELTPLGAQGNKLEQNLAEHLVRSNLLKRAAKMLSHQVNHRLSGEEKLRVAIRLAAIELKDDNPQKAVNALAKANEEIRKLKDSPQKADQQKEIELLRIRAYAQNKEYDKSLSLLEKLEPSKTVSRLKADIAWKAGYWEQAAKHLNAVIIDENLTPESNLTPEQADLILNRAIALNLSDKPIALANIRAKYTPLMTPTGKANQFEVITRPRRIISVDDREALLATVAEVEIFKDFLESYKQN